HRRRAQAGIRPVVAGDASVSRLRRRGHGSSSLRLSGHRQRGAAHHRSPKRARRHSRPPRQDCDALAGAASMRNALTFDLEEYFHAEVFAGLVESEDWSRLGSRIKASTLRLLETLDRWKTSATFFVLGWLADRHPALVREIHARGHEVACHGYMHRL